ncbi:MAG: SAM-dependent DNA methyltransferase [Burkholderiales bacterium]|nr:SAM-dependent DNA methyltransferase [Burkholderiales bacterium]
MHSKDIDQDVINRTIWEACDTFRGTVDASIYKNYVLTMLFLKYISDVWIDHHANNLGPIAHLQIFALPDAANFYTLYEQRQHSGNGARLDRALKLIEQHNRDTLQGVFEGISFNITGLKDPHKQDSLLRHLLEDFAKPALDLRPSQVGIVDVIGNAYEFLIKNFASDSGKKAGEFYTPAEISHLIARLVAPQTGETIYDPACGSGSLLMKCSRLIRQNANAEDYQLFGQESMPSTWALAKKNMFLHGEINHRIEQGDTLRSPKFLHPDGSLMQFDAVVANPPFSLDKWGEEEARTDRWQRFARGVPPKNIGDYAFILHMVESMKPDTGRMAVVVASGVLFRGGVEGKIRAKLVTENLIDAVISLPGKVFFGTDLAASILLLKRQRSTQDVLFIDDLQDYR